MTDIVLKANRKTPGISTVGNDLESHTRALQAISEAIAIHERRTKNLLSSFVRIEELVDLGVLDYEGNTLSLSDDIGSATTVDWDDVTNIPALVDDIGDLADPNADRILFWDDSAGIVTFLTATEGVTITGTNLLTTGMVHDISALVDPNADRLLFWDDSAGAVAFLTPGTGLTITGTTISVNGGDGTLTGLTDVDVYLPVVGDTLVYDGYGWVNQPRGDFAKTLEEIILAQGPTGYWKFDEAAGDIKDYSGNAFNLTTIVNVTYRASMLVPSLPETRFARINTSSGEASRSGVLGTAPPLVGDWTMTCVVMSPNIQTNPVELFRMGATGETAVTNFQFDFNLTTAGLLGCLWEQGLGTDVPNATTTSLIEAKPYHLALVKDGTADTLSFYVNGMLMVTNTYSSEPTGGTDPAMNFGFGGTNAGATSAYLIGHAAFFNGKKLSPFDIAAQARAAGLFGV